jgi:hypothetical protein
MIGIQISGKNDRLLATAFIRSLNNFLELVKDIDSIISRQPRGSVRWEVVALQKSSPALVELAGVSRVKTMDYVPAIQQTVIDGIEQLTDRPEQPQFYSYSALKKVRSMAEQAKHVKSLSIFTDSRRAYLTPRVFNNVEYIIGTGSRSLGSVRGSLDAITVHTGHEFRIWSPKTKRPITCKFERTMLPEVIDHLKQQVEVVGELHRNQKGEPILMNVREFVPLEPAKTVPTLEEMSGLVPDLYGGQSLKHYLDELRNG